MKCAARLQASEIAVHRAPLLEPAALLVPLQVQLAPEAPVVAWEEVPHVGKLCLATLVGPGVAAEPEHCRRRSSHHCHSGRTSEWSLGLCFWRELSASQPSPAGGARLLPQPSACRWKNRALRGLH